MSTPPLVVVIEDDEAGLTALGRLLRAGGFDSALYRSAEDFLGSPPEQRPRCIVLDVHLPGMSGLDLQRRLNALGSAIPVIVMTAFDDVRVRVQAQRLGCLAYLDKAAGGSRLLALLQGL